MTRFVRVMPPLVARLGLGASFLSAVADRFGVFGPPGAPHVAWGDFAHFVAYTRQLTPLAPTWLVPTLAWGATLAEIGVSVLLLPGLFSRHAALVAGGLLSTFAIAMATSIGIKAPLDYSVFSAAAAAFLVASYGPGAFSVDHALRSHARNER